MKYLKNNEGYALLLVLFLIVFLISVSSIVANGSLNHSKQEVTTDISNQSIVAAEMGVDYFKVLGKVEYNRIKFHHYNILINKINSYYTSPEFSTHSDMQKEQKVNNIKNDYLINIGEAINDYYSNFSQRITVNDQIYYELGNIGEDIPSYQINEDKVVINVNVKGVSNNKVSNLKFDMNIPSPTLVITPVKPIESKWVPPSFIEMEKKILDPSAHGGINKCVDPLVNITCLGDNLLDLKLLNNTTVFTTNYNYGTGNLNYSLKKSTFYNNGFWELHNAIGLSDVTVFSNNDVTVKNIDASSTYFQVKGDFTGEQVELSNSTFNLIGDFVATKHFYAVNTNLCVEGSINLQKKTVLSNVNIYYTGSLTPSNLSGNNSIVKWVSPESLRNECPISNPNHPDVDNPDVPQSPIISAFWEDPYLKVTY
ncbi:hypothetical protein [Paenisporosarcina antarctica]|uniref:Uncharacterized protein n=1 Tax=Paenisporosarcina antarctica TaxID=417367 RepID=A0A4P6ZW01_9BACL|nr:hypothetical protein [Paenisporosarcina antarctica]QBP40760.1 hypothetical protein E2636_06335 [Paenisporosarcina antarctica]